MGKLQQHRIQNREPKKPQSYKPLIEEIKQLKKFDNKRVCLELQNDETGYIILRKPLEDPVESLIVLFDMPRSVSHKFQIV